MPPFIASAWVEALPWAEACVIGMAFVVGAALGSFLNVVAHRIPRGESPVMGGSRCPACGRGILPRDNVPVLGWLMLRGRCRSCRAAIPRRYVVVEVACGGLLATLACARLACDRHGLDRLLVQGDVRPLVLFGGQAAVLMTLAAWSLLAERGHRVARSTRWLTLAGVVGWAVLVTVLEAEPRRGGNASSWPWLAPLLTSLGGGGVGWLIGWFASGLCRRLVPGPSTPVADRDMLTIVGAALGWQPTVVVAVVTVVLHLVARGTPLARYGTPLAAVLAMSACPRWLDALTGFTGWLR